MEVYRSAVVAVIFFTHSALRLKNFPCDLARVAVDVNDLSESVETNKKKNAQLKAINSTESARESISRSKATKPRKRGCFQPDG
jgi:hypothetical protein